MAETYTHQGDIAMAIARSQREIIAEVKAGRTPATVASFSDLHDYADANEYGGLCDEGSDWDADDANAVQDAVDLWVKSGALADLAPLCETCDAPVGTGVGNPAILVSEGGDIPDTIICGECLTAVEEGDAERADYLVDCAVTGEYHSCVEWATYDADKDAPYCAGCRLQLSRAGDAVVMPDAIPED